MIRPARPEEIQQACKEMATIDPWLHLGILAEELCHVMAVDKLRKMLVYDHYCTIQGAVIVRPIHAAEHLFHRGFGESLAQRYNVEYPCDWQDLPDAGYIGSLAVFGNETGHGIGVHLLDAAYKEIRNSGNSRAYLMVSDFNRRAMNFYDREGFEHIARIQDCIRPGNVENLMEKKLY